MGIINVNVGSRTYQLACEDGQENNLLATVDEINKRFDTLSRSLRTGNEPLLLVMTALMIQDEFNEYKKKYEISSDKGKQKRDDEIADMLNTVSAYLENIIDKVEKD